MNNGFRKTVDKVAWAGQLEQDSWDTGQLGQDSRDRIDGSGQDIWEQTTGIGQPRPGGLDKSA
jgi:hypothetical protein